MGHGSSMCFRRLIPRLMEGGRGQQRWVRMCDNQYRPSRPGGLAHDAVRLRQHSGNVIYPDMATASSGDYHLGRSVDIKIAGGRP